MAFTRLPKGKEDECVAGGMARALGRVGATADMAFGPGELEETLAVLSAAR